MPTEIAVVDPVNPSASIIARAAELLRSGGLVAFPTETVYGLGADATNAAAVERIYRAKGRPATNPMIIHVGDIEAAKACSTEWPIDANRLAEAFWPGPLTIVVPASKSIAPIALAGGSTVGLRMPNNPIALALLRAVDRPIAAPSANRSETLSPTTTEHVLRTLNGRIDFILDGGPTTGGVESTVVDLSVHPPRLLRPGLVTAKTIRAHLPLLEVASGAETTEIEKSPGRSPRHYAPATPLELASDIVERVRQSTGSIAVVTFGEIKFAESSNERIVHRRLPNDPTGAARELYGVLHELDLVGLDGIVVQTPPSGDDWSAVRDRLQRASTRQ